jgi:hypothetical protein
LLTWCFLLRAFYAAAARNVCHACSCCPSTLEPIPSCCNGRIRSCCTQRHARGKVPTPCAPHTMCVYIMPPVLRYASCTQQVFYCSTCGVTQHIVWGRGIKCRLCLGGVGHYPPGGGHCGSESKPDFQVCAEEFDAPARCLGRCFEH